MKTCVCVICFKPNPIWMNFLKTFTHYDVVVVADDNSVRHPGCVQVSNTTCAAHGFSDTSFTLKKKISGWDKALFYFAHQNYDQVWFLEDDVFLHDEAALMAIDREYSGDFLSNTMSMNPGNEKSWHWPVITIRIPPPYYCAMCCAVRVSRRLLWKVKEYARVYRTLFFLEALLPTLSKSLVAQSPPQLANILYQGEYPEMNRSFLYHPVKNIEKHAEFRNKNNYL